MEAPFRRTVGNTIESPAGVATRPPSDAACTTHLGSRPAELAFAH